MLFKKMIIFCILTALTMRENLALANDDTKNPNTKAVTSETQDFLKSKEHRKTVIESDPKAKKVDNFAKKIAGSEENLQEMYNISADVLPVLMEMNGDDPAKAIESLESFTKNPAEFLKSLPPDIKKRIESLSKKIEGEKTKPKP